MTNVAEKILIHWATGLSKGKVKSTVSQAVAKWGDIMRSARS